MNEQRTNNPRKPDFEAAARVQSPSAGMTRRIIALRTVLVSLAVLLVDNALAADREGMIAPAAGADYPIAGASQIRVPILGYVVTRTPRVEMRVISGTSASPAFGEAVDLPEDVTDVFLPPGQEYAVLKRSGSVSLNVARTLGIILDEPLQLTDSLLDVHTVQFSPVGATAALLSRTEKRIEVISGLPREPRIVGSHELPTGLGDIERFIVSDDGLIVISTATGELNVPQKGQSPRKLSGVICTGAFTFLPKSRGIVAFDDVSQGLGTVADVTGLDVFRPLPDQMETASSDVRSTDSGLTCLAVGREQSVACVDRGLGVAFAHRGQSTGSLMRLSTPGLWVWAEHAGSHVLVNVASRQVSLIPDLRAVRIEQ